MIKKILVVIIGLTTLIILGWVVIGYIFFAFSVEIEGKKKDDWRIKLNAFMSDDPLISNHPLFSNKQPPTYYFSPLQWNSDEIESIEYVSCLSKQELTKKYRNLLSKDGKWQEKTGLNYRNKWALSFNKSQLDNNMKINRLLSIEALENNCFNVAYIRTKNE